MATPLHQQRIEAVLQALLDSGAESVLDLGCGPGPLLMRLVNERQFRKIVAIDTSIDALRVVADRLRNANLANSDRVGILQASFMCRDDSLFGFDAAVMLETIEHVMPDRLSRVESVVFGIHRPKLILITTPNRDYNILYGIPEGQYRHEDHRFEWSRPKFERWATGVANRNDYDVVFSGVGEPHPIYGSPSQMASFARVDAFSAIAINRMPAQTQHGQSTE